MSKYFFFLSIILSTSSFIIGMDKKVPKLSIPSRANNNGSHPYHPHTPRYGAQSTETPAYKSQAFNYFINGLNSKEDLIELIKSLDNPKYLMSYGPAQTLRNLINGTIDEHSPFSSKDIWKNYQPSGIEKQKYIETSLRIITEKALKSNNPEDKQKHIQNYLHIIRITEKN